ncbi:hypothetical protein LY76DRAFT_151391 [Colletotrichum caudatum]|nr:hypothetical protein LY76DRAFT_151391 [Colletotrichum caudatum]
MELCTADARCAVECYFLIRRGGRPAAPAQTSAHDPHIFSRFGEGAGSLLHVFNQHGFVRTALEGVILSTLSMPPCLTSLPFPLFQEIQIFIGTFIGLAHESKCLLVSLDIPVTLLWSKGGLRPVMRRTDCQVRTATVSSLHGSRPHSLARLALPNPPWDTRPDSFSPR